MHAKKEERRKILDAGKFVLFLIVALAVLGLLVSLVPGLFFEHATAQASSAILNAIGVQNRVDVGNQVLIQLKNENNSTVIINDLCTGVLETVVLVAAILATFEIAWKKRVMAALVAVLAIFVFNQIRIVSTVFFILHAPLDIVVLSHDIFFRIFLFVTIAVFYGVFLNWGKNHQRAKNR